MSGSDLTYEYERLNANLEFRPVGDGPLRYAGTTEQPVEYVAAVTDTGKVRGYLWICDEDGAADFEAHLVTGEFNGTMFWDRKLRDARAREILPSQALEELLAEEGRFLSGRLDPASRAVGTLTDVKALAARGYRPPQEPYRPRGRRPDPKLGFERAESARSVGWVYQVDEGHDPAGRVPPEAVAGAWQVTPSGRVRHFWHNPAYGQTPPAPATAGKPAPVPPLRAGRRPAGRALLSWLDDPRAPRLCRIAGSSGSGRTHLLGWLAAACPPGNPHPTRRVHAVLSAEGLTVRSATWLLAERLGVVARTPDDLMTVLQDGVPRALVITDLDRAGGDLLAGMPERIAAELLTPLLQIPWLRLLVESASGTPAAAALSAAVPSGAVLDLDDPGWTDPEAFTAWCAALPGRPPAADQVFPSPGLALLAARTPAGAPLDPAAAPAERAAALAVAWWSALPEQIRPTVSALVAAGRSVTGEEWGALPGVGGAQAITAASAHLPAADAGTWRLGPDQLAHHVAAVSPPVDHTALLRDIAGAIPRGDDGRPMLRSTDPGWLGLLLRHAVHAGAGDQLLSDPDFLIHADPAAITAAFERTQSDGPRTALAEAWHLAGPVRPAAATPADRAAALHAWLAGRDRQAADHCAAVSGQRWRASWSGPLRGRVPAQVPRGETEVIRIIRGHGHYAGHLLVTVSGVLRILDPETGLDSERIDLSRMPDSGHAAMVCGQDGSLFFLGRDGKATAWPHPSQHGGNPTRAVDWATKNFSDGVTAMAAFVGDGRPLLAIGDGGGGLAWIDLEDNRHGTPGQPLHQGAVTAVDLTETAGRITLVSGGADGAVRSWSEGRDLPPDPIDARDCPITAVAVVTTPNGTVTASAWADGLVRVRRRGDSPTTLDLRLGLPAVSLLADTAGRVFVALPEGIVALTLDDPPQDPGDPEDLYGPQEQQPTQLGPAYELRHDRPDVVATGPAGSAWCRVSCWFDGRAADRHEMYAVTADGPWGRAEARAADAFGALLDVRRQLEPQGWRLALAGARRDVWPSGMIRDSGGEEGYVLAPTAPGEHPLLVSIFADAAPDEVVAVAEQEAAARAWHRQG